MRGRRKGTDMEGVYQAIGELSPHKLQPVGRKFAESVAQPCSIRCTASHNFKISTSECIRYPPKCAFLRVSNEKFSGEGAQPPPSTPPPAGRGKPPPPIPPLLAPRRSDSRAFGARSTPTKRKLVPSTFGTKLLPWSQGSVATRLRCSGPSGMI